MPERRAVSLLPGKMHARKVRSMAGVGAKLRTIRRQLRLSLREVEQRSGRIAQERADPSYKVSADWLRRLENEEYKVTANKLTALAEVYSIPTDQLTRVIHKGDAQSLILDQPSGPNTPKSVTEGSLKSRPKCTLPLTPIPDQSPDHTTLLPVGNRRSGTPYRQGIIGKLDQTLNPMIPAGSIVQIDTTRRKISSTKGWTHEFQRPIYFLSTPEGYVCGWCELDSDSEWLTLVPHPRSPATSRRWKYRTEVENLGRVIAVGNRSGE